MWKHMPLKTIFVAKKKINAKNLSNCQPTYATLSCYLDRIFTVIKCSVNFSGIKIWRHVPVFVYLQYALMFFSKKKTYLILAFHPTLEIEWLFFGVKQREWCTIWEMNINYNNNNNNNIDLCNYKSSRDTNSRIYLQNSTMIMAIKSRLTSTNSF